VKKKKETKDDDCNLCVSRFAWRLYVAIVRMMFIIIVALWRYGFHEAACGGRGCYLRNRKCAIAVGRCVLEDPQPC